MCLIVYTFLSYINTGTLNILFCIDLLLWTYKTLVYARHLTSIENLMNIPDRYHLVIIFCNLYNIHKTNLDFFRNLQIFESISYGLKLCQYKINYTVIKEILCSPWYSRHWHRHQQMARYSENPRLFIVSQAIDFTFLV